MELVVAKTLSDQVYDIILERIFSGEYRQGQKLSVNKLAKEFNVSRSPVNDALNKLCGACILESNQHNSCTIRTLSAKQIADLMEYRKALELYVADTAFDVLTQDCYGKLQEISAASSALLNGSSIQELMRFFELDEQFHQTFISAADNEIISQDYSMANKLLRLVSIQFLEARNASEKVLWEHSRIIEAIGEKDLQAVKAAICEHYEQVMSRMRDL